MAVKLRLQRVGRKKKPFYVIVAANSRTKRDGKYIERLGYYDPKTVPATIELDNERALNWLQKGAIPTDTVRAILRYKGVLYYRHLLRGVKKGALTQEEADKKYQAFLEEKAQRVTDKIKQLEKAYQKEMEKIREAESQKREAMLKERQAKLEKAEAPEAAPVSAPEATEEPGEPDIDQVAREAAIERGEIPAEKPTSEAETTEEPPAETTEPVAKEEPVAAEESPESSAEDKAKTEHPAENESAPETEKKEEGKE